MNSPEQTRNAWNSVAANYDEFVTPLSMKFGEGFLQRVGLHQDMRFLDVAAGSGALSIPAARLGTQVVATDISPAMVERLNIRAREEGLSNLEGRVMDGHALEFEDDTFDVSASLAGVSVLPDIQLGLREMVRVTKPGGRVLVIAFGPPQKMEFLTFFMGAMKANVPGFNGLPMDPPPPQFQVADPGKFRQEMTEAGLNKAEVETAIWGMEIQSGMHLWDAVLASNPVGRVLVANLTSEQKLAVQETMGTMLHERSEGGRAIVNTEMNVGIGSK